MYHLLFRSAWAIAVTLAGLGAIVDAAGVLEIDMVFPRNDTVYAPTDSMPIVFAFRNAELARYLNPSIEYYVRRRDAPVMNDNVLFNHDLRWTANWTSHEPYFAYTFFNNFTTEGHWWISWDIFTQSCDENNFGEYYQSIMTSRSSYSMDIYFKKGGQVVDLVAGTANSTSCPEEFGTTIDVTDKTMDVPSTAHWRGNDTCVVVESSTTTPNPCLVKIDAAAAASMSAASLCHSLNPPADCPSVNVAQRLAVANAAGLAVAFGAFGFLLG